MVRIPIALIAGLLFGARLACSGMSISTRVRAFLDLFGGRWDPTLAFVMGGAIAPMALAWVIRRRMETPLADGHFSLPDTREINPRLIGGGAIFGIGWGIAGLCPGPAIADLAIRPTLAAPFVIAMLAGFAVQRIIDRPKI